MKKMLIVFVTLFLISGCYNYKELNDIGIVSAFSIDKEDEDFIINAQLVNIIEGGEKGISESPISVISGKGKTITEAARSLNLKSPKVFFISNLEYVLLSEKVIRDNLEDVLDYLTRDTRLPLNFLIITTNESSIKDVLSVLSQFDINSATNLSKIIKFSEKRYGMSFSLTVKDLLSDYLSKTSSIVFPSVEVIKEDEEFNQSEGLQKSEIKNYVEISDLILFSSDKDFVKLEKNEKYGYNFLNNHIENATLTIKCDGGYFTLETLKSNFNYDNYKDNDITLKASLSTEITSYGCEYDLYKTESLDKLKDLSKEYIIKTIDDTISLAKDNKSDFIKVGSFVYKNYNDSFDFENGDFQREKFPFLNFNYEIDIDIRKQGNLRGDI